MGNDKGDEETTTERLSPYAKPSEIASYGEFDAAPGFRIFHHVFPRLVLVVYFVILFLWIYQAEGGLGFTPTSLFGLHALLMSAFVVIFVQEALLAYSSPLLGPFLQTSTTQRIWHILLHIGALAFGVCGMTAIVYYKSLSGMTDMFPFFTLYSPHSWMGVSVLSLWALQALAKVLRLVWSLLGKAQDPAKNERFRQVHAFKGKLIYVAGLATMAMGFQDMQSSDLAGAGYPPKGQLAVYAAVAPILLLLVGSGVFVLLSKPRARAVS